MSSYQKFKRGWFWLVPAAFLALALLLWSRLGVDPQVILSEVLGKPLPRMSLPDLNSDLPVTNERLPTKPFLLNAWATWCPSCKQEHAFLTELNSQGVLIVGLDFRDDATAAREYLLQAGDPYDLVHPVDQEGLYATELGLTGTPETYLVGGDGVVYMHHVGILTPEVWQQNGFAACYQGLLESSSEGCA